MTDDGPKDQASVISAEVPPEATECPDRRSFMRGTLTAASAVAAGGLVASAAAAEQGKGEAARGAVQKLTGAVHVHFDSRKQPSLEDLQGTIRQIVGRAGCPTCGLLGIDIRLHLGDPVEIQSRVPVNISVEHALES